MGITYEFIVRSEPRPQPRPRASRIAGRIRIYTPASASLYKAAVQASAREAIPFEDGPIDSAVSFEVEFVMRRPARIRKGEVFVPHICRPDIDNLLKSTLDAIVDAGILKDDCFVAKVTMSKRYANPEESSHTRISLTVEETHETDKIEE